MAVTNWEKSQALTSKKTTQSSERWKFLLGGGLLIVAVVYLIFTGTSTGAQYFLTVDDIVQNAEYAGKSVRITGAVIGESIEYDSRNLILDFTIAHIPNQTEDLAATLHNAVNNPQATQLKVHLEGQVKPDLLQHEAQAIISGTLGEDGIFYATELLLKCPSRYEENVPAQVQAASN